MASVSHEVASGENAVDIIANNLAMYEQDIARASSLGANIILFPEFGIGGVFESRTTMFPFCNALPPLGTIPCATEANTSVSYSASCLAKKYNIIVVVNTCEYIPCSPSNSSNTCPEDGRFQYNTEIVLDETGHLLAIYHKSHPFYVNCFDTPHPYDVITYNTSLGVEFGIFVCLDIAFDEPSEALHAKGARSFTYSSSISNATAEFAFQEWSKMYQSTLLVSNLGHSVAGVFVNGTHLSNQVVDVGNGDAITLTNVLV